MLESAEVISLLKKENINLRKDIQTPSRSEHESKADNEKSIEKNIVKSLQKQIISLNCALHGAEEMVTLREKEVSYLKIFVFTIYVYYTPCKCSSLFRIQTYPVFITD